MKNIHYNLRVFILIVFKIKAKDVRFLTNWLVKYLFFLKVFKKKKRFNKRSQKFIKLKYLQKKSSATYFCRA